MPNTTEQTPIEIAHELLGLHGPDNAARIAKAQTDKLLSMCNKWENVQLELKRELDRRKLAGRERYGY